MDYIVTVTGVLTVSDQFAGSAYIQDASCNCCFDKTVHGTGLFKKEILLLLLEQEVLLQVKFKLVP
jgi:hypothetical protein